MDRKKELENCRQLQAQLQREATKSNSNTNTTNVGSIVNGR